MDTRDDGHRSSDRGADRARGRLRQPSRRSRRADALRHHRGGRPRARLRGAKWPSCRRPKRWRSTGVFTGCGRASTRSPSASRGSPPNCSTPAPTWGPAVAATFLQRALTALNRNGKDYPDLVPDGRIGEQTLAALDGFLNARGKAAARPCCCAPWKHCRASATSAWLSAALPTSRSSMAGLRTESISATENGASPRLLRL